MTAPEPAPGAPVVPAQAAPVQQPAVPAPPHQPPAQPAAAEDISTLPEWAQRHIHETRAEAAKARTDAKAAAAAEARRELTAEFAKTLGLDGATPPTAAELMTQATAAREAAWSYAVEAEILRGTDAATAQRLLDSVSFLDSLDDLGDLAPNTPEFKEKLAAKVQEAAAKLTPAPAGQAPATGPRPDPSQGARGGPPARPSSLGEALTRHYKAKA